MTMLISTLAYTLRMVLKSKTTKFGFRFKKLGYKNVYCVMYYKFDKMTDFFIRKIILVLYLDYIVLILFAMRCLKKPALLICGPQQK